MSVAIIGAGYWGKNLIRNFNELGALHSVFDMNETLLDRYRNDPKYTGVKFAKECSYTDILHNKEIKGIVIATPPSTHFAIAMGCLGAGKHVFIEKPMTLDVESSQLIVDKAKQANLKVLVGHIYLYAPEILKLKEIVKSDDFGELLYVYTDRLNLGKVQDCGVLQDLAPHDISVVNYLTDSNINGANAYTFSRRFNDVADTAFIHTQSANGVVATMNLSWLVPTKTRVTTVVGSNQTAICDSVQKTIKIYKSNIYVENTSGNYSEHLLNYKHGDIIEPFIEVAEPLKLECQDFLDAIHTGKEPTANGQAGLEVVKVLAAMEESSSKDNWVKV